MKSMPDPYHVVAGSGDRIKLADGRWLIDAISSWWCMIHGYAHPDIVASMVDQVERLPHVMLGGLVHDPALQLAQTLAQWLPGRLNHVFYSDSGSVGVEVAIKMAIQYFINSGVPGRNKIAFLTGAYHGDTTGAMSVCDPDDGMHQMFASLLPVHRQLPRPPKLGVDASEYLGRIEQILMSDTSIAAIIIEPVMQGAGGFYLYDPSVLKGFRLLCDRFEILLIADEVATGFGRLGRWFGVDFGPIVPDIMVLGKGLTGGHIGLAATVATDDVFDRFYTDNSRNALMHGPTFMGNPIACRAALASINLLTNTTLIQISAVENQLRQLIELNDLPHVTDVRVMGALGVVEVDDPMVLDGLTAFAVDRGVWLRPFGTVVYTTPPFGISQSNLQRVIDVIREWFEHY